MKFRTRILAILLTLALMLCAMPVTFAAEQVTVTWVTPSGTTTETVEEGGTVVFPDAASYGDYTFDCWVTRTFELSDGSDIYEFYYPEYSRPIYNNSTFYALYYFAESELDVPLFYWPRFYEDDYPDDYTGDYALVGFNLDPEDSDSLDVEHPQVLSPEGKTVDIANQYGVDCDPSLLTFSTASMEFTYKFEMQANGTYTIRSYKTGEYLTLSGMDITFVSTPIASSYWNISIDGFGYECIVSAQNDDMYLLYDYVEEQFAILDIGEVYVDACYPLDLFFIALYARETMNYMYTTNVPGVTPDEPIEPDEPVEPIEPIEPNHDCPAAKYTDLDLNSWYHSGVDFMLKNGYMNGVSSTTFRPDGTLNRAMVATVLYRIAGQPTVEGSATFSDVADGTWYTDAVIWAQENGIVTGYNDGTFRPTKEITRQEMAVMLARCAKILCGADTSGGTGLNSYPDAGDVASWAEEAMQWCVHVGLINGIQSGGVSNLKPGNNATRAQFATIMMRFLELELYF